MKRIIAIIACIIILTLTLWFLVTEQQQKEEEIVVLPELEWVEGYNVNAGEEITGPALVQIPGEWIIVYNNDLYTIPENGYVNIYSGNALGLEQERERLLKEAPEIKAVPELEWLGFYHGFEGDVVEGPALIQKREGYVIKVYHTESYTMTKYGIVHKYDGNRAGLDAEYNRLMGIEEEAEETKEVGETNTLQFNAPYLTPQ